MIYDLVIVGGGPAGLSAALTASYLKLNHVILEARLPGGTLVHNYPSKKVDSFLGLKGLTGKEVAERMTEHVESEGSKIKHNEEVKGIKKRKNVFEIKTSKGSYESKTVLIAMGISGCPRKLGISGEANEKVHYSLKDPNEFKGKTCFVVGGGDSAVETAVMLDKVCKKVYLAHRKGKLRAMDKNQKAIKKSKVEILWNTELKKIEKNKAEVINNKTNEKSEIKTDEIFIFCGSVLDIEFLKKIGLKMKGNHVVVDEGMMTNIEGLYSAGDITGKLKRIPEAIGEGHLAVYSIFKYLRKPYWA